MYTENATQIDIVLDRVETKQAFKNARLAMEVVTMVNEPIENALENATALSVPQSETGNFTMQVSRSLDDEYTPGVFKVNIDAVLTTSNKLLVIQQFHD